MNDFKIIPDPEPLRKELIKHHTLGHKLETLQPLDEEDKDEVLILRRWQAILFFLCPKNWLVMCKVPLPGFEEESTKGYVLKKTPAFEAYQFKAPDVDFLNPYLQLKMLNLEVDLEKTLFYSGDVAKYVSTRETVKDDWETIARAVLLEI